MNTGNEHKSKHESIFNKLNTGKQKNLVQHTKGNAFHTLLGGSKQVDKECVLLTENEEAVKLRLVLLLFCCLLRLASRGLLGLN